MGVDLSGLTPAQCCRCQGFVISACDSTMDLAWRLYAQGRFPEYAWVLAHTQTRGRGRQGRVWVSEPGSLAVTLRLPDMAALSGPLLSMAMALPLIRALGELHVPALIKWPNDVLIHDRKAGGILIEEKQGVFMAGIGMNIQSALKTARRRTFSSAGWMFAHFWCRIITFRHMAAFPSKYPGSVLCVDSRPGRRHPGSGYRSGMEK